LIPSIIEIRQHKSYLRRLTALQAFAMMATEMGPDAATLDILPLILEMASDSVSIFFLKLFLSYLTLWHLIKITCLQVPNIRFNVAKELSRVSPVCNSSTYNSQVVPVLTMLRDDDDLDVRQYAEQTSVALQEVFIGK
jgi:hypothetical protein